MWEENGWDDGYIDEELMAQQMMMQQQMMNNQNMAGYGQNIINFGQFDQTIGYGNVNQPQIDINEDMLISLGFSQVEIACLQEMLFYGMKPTAGKMQNLGFHPEEARRVKYLYDIVSGKTVIDNTDALVKHLKKMSGNGRKISIQDLAVSKIQRVPRLAVVAGIKHPTFEIYNSNKFSAIKDKFYEVKSATSKRIVVTTNRKPQLKWKEAKKVEGVVEILELFPNGKVDVAFDKNYARLCNRYIIVASMRLPEFHHGMYEIICIEGTKVYVFARSLGTGENVSYQQGLQRIYDYGILNNGINIKLERVAREIHSRLCGVFAAFHPATQDFILIPEERKKDEDEIEFDEDE